MILAQIVSIDDIVRAMRRNPRDVRYTDLCRVCDHYFGKARTRGTSHRVYRMPWPGDPRVKIQRSNGKAKAYQVRQVLWAIARLEKESAERGG